MDELAEAAAAAARGKGLAVEVGDERGHTDTGIDASDMTVDVTFDKLENPTRLANLKVRIDLPHGECADRQAAIQRVAEHCPVHETITTMQDVEFQIFDKATHELVLA